jgi:hypothetical protein
MGSSGLEIMTVLGHKISPGARSVKVSELQLERGKEKIFGKISGEIER